MEAHLTDGKAGREAMVLIGTYRSTEEPDGCRDAYFGVLLLLMGI